MGMDKLKIFKKKKVSFDREMHDDQENIKIHHSFFCFIPLF